MSYIPPFNDGAALFEIYIYENRINSVENEKTLAESSLYEELKKKIRKRFK